MKATGIVRKIDELGRLVIPKELRRTLDINESDPIEIFTQDDAIVLRKYQSSCYFCDSADDLTDFKGKKICTRCREALGESL